MTSEMKGVCPFCGQSRLVFNSCTESEANMEAARYCACDNPIKKTRILNENIDQLCGTGCEAYGLKQVTEEVVDVLKAVGSLLVSGHIETAQLRIEDTTVNIRRTSDSVRIERKKTLSARLEA